MDNQQENIKLSPSLEEAERFLKLLDPTAKRFTFQLKPESDKAKEPLTKTGKPPKAFNKHGSIEKVFLELKEKNLEGYGVFVTVNETTFSYRTNENNFDIALRDFKAVRSVWIDFDGKPEESVEPPIEPSIKVISSEGKYHSYFLCSELSEEEHRAVQERLVDDYNSDENAKDLVRTLRLPGFYNMKSKLPEPQLVKMVIETGKQYTKEEILTAFPPIYRNKKATPIATPETLKPNKTKEEALDEILENLSNASEGERHNARYNAGMAIGRYQSTKVFKDKDLQEVFAAVKEVSDFISENGITSPSELQTIQDGYELAISTAKTSKQVHREALEANAPIVNGEKLTLNFKGQIEPTTLNVCNALADSSFSGITIAYDTYIHRLVYKLEGQETFSPISDNTYTDFIIKLCKKGFADISTDMIRKTVFKTAKDNTFDSAVDFLNNLEPWDGIKRVEQFATTYWGVEESNYAKAVSLYIWTALTGRMYAPEILSIMGESSFALGFKADMAPILTGKQGVGKSTTLERLQLIPNSYGSIHFNMSEDDITRNLRGKSIIELEELKGLSSKDAEHIKKFISDKEQTITEKYLSTSQTEIRRCLFFGTTNADEFLTDPTGNRRFLPLVINNIDFKALKQDLHQLYAEGLHLLKENNLVPLYKQAEEEASKILKQYVVSDIWETTIELYLNSTKDFHKAGCTCGKHFKKDDGSTFVPSALTTAYIITQILEKPIAAASIADKRRIKEVMAKLGYEEKSIYYAPLKKAVRQWISNNPTDFEVDVDLPIPTSINTLTVSPTLN